MKYKEFIRNVGKAGLTLKEFAELIKINRISLSNYSQKGEVPDHLAIIATLMGILADNEIPFIPSIEKLDLTIKHRLKKETGSLPKKIS